MILKQNSYFTDENIKPFADDKIWIDLIWYVLQNKLERG